MTANLEAINIVDCRDLTPTLPRKNHVNLYQHKKFRYHQRP